MRHRDGRDRRTGHAGTDGLDMGIDDGARCQPQLQQAIGQVLRNGRRASDAVDLNTLRVPQQACRLRQRVHREQAARLMERSGMGGKDVIRDGRRIIAPMQIFLNQANRLDQIPRQENLELLKPANVHAAAKGHDRAFADATCLGHLGDRHVNERLGLREDQLGDLPGLGRKLRLQFTDAGEDAVHGRSCIEGRTCHPRPRDQCRNSSDTPIRLAQGFNSRLPP